jgi:acetyl esterase/lipase
MAAALADAGYAVWSIEYRRIGQAGGGWPGTFDDVAAGADYLRTLAPAHHLNLDRVLAVGHSAGGQLVLWLASRGGSALPLRGVVGLAAITDLATYGREEGSCNASVYPLMGGTPEDHPDRYAAVSPIERRLNAAVRLVHGDADRTVRIDQAERYATRMGPTTDVKVVPVPGAAHFDVIAPASPAWASVLSALAELR